MVFAVKPPTTPGGTWSRRVLQRFSPSGEWGPSSPVVVHDGAVYGTVTTRAGGEVFKLIPSAGGKWTMTVLHRFGKHIGPYGTLVMDGSGTIFGTTIPAAQEPPGIAYSLVP